MYTFFLPQIFLGCLIYPLQDSERFVGWQIEQPIVLVIDDKKDIFISNSYFKVRGYCSNRNVLVINGPRGQ